MIEEMEFKNKDAENLKDLSEDCGLAVNDHEKMELIGKPQDVAASTATSETIPNPNNPIISTTRRKGFLSDIVAVVANSRQITEGTERHIDHRRNSELSNLEKDVAGAVKEKTTTSSREDDEGEVTDTKNNNGSWWSLQDASDSIKGNKQIMIQAVQEDWRALRYATNKIKADKDVVMEAVRHDGRAILWAPDQFRYDEDAVIEMIRQNGNCLRFASPELRSNKQFVMTAVANKPESLKFALGNLNQDRDCSIAAGLWDESYDQMKIHDDRRRRRSSLLEEETDASSSLTTTSLDGLVTDSYVKKIVLSTRFALNEDSSPTATKFTILLKEHPYFTQSAAGNERELNGNNNEDDNNNNNRNEFTIYSPNAFNKATCDPNWTDINWPCRGTFQSCKLAPELKVSNIPQQQLRPPPPPPPPPLPSCCWRYSFRYHLEEAKQTDGFMIQIVELRPKAGSSASYEFKHEVGKGQEIERIMATDVGTKIFVAYQPMNIQHKYRKYFDEDDIFLLVAAIQDWYAHNCVDMALCHVGDPIL